MKTTTDRRRQPRPAAVRAKIAEGQRRFHVEREAELSDLRDLRDRVDVLLAPGDDLSRWLKSLLGGRGQP